MANKIVTLQNTDKTEGRLPRTCLKALFDDNGDYLDNQLTASDINALKNGAISSLSPLINPTFITTGCTYDSAFVYSSGGYCKIGKIAFINFLAKINSAAKSLYIQLPFTLPLQQCISFVNWSTDTGPFYGAVRTDGQIILTPNASGSNYIISGVVFCN